MVFQKRAQAALEFLTTYGWAFLLILVMIGGLSYFGVLDPSKYVPESCIAEYPFECVGAVYHAESNGNAIYGRSGMFLILRAVEGGTLSIDGTNPDTWDSYDIDSNCNVSGSSSIHVYNTVINEDSASSRFRLRETPLTGAAYNYGGSTRSAEPSPEVLTFRYNKGDLIHMLIQCDDGSVRDPVSNFNIPITIIGLNNQLEKTINVVGRSKVHDTGISVVSGSYTTGVLDIAGVYELDA